MSGAGRDLWTSPGPSLLPPTAQDHVQIPFDFLQGWRIQNLHGQLVPALCVPCSKKSIS